MYIYIHINIRDFPMKIMSTIISIINEEMNWIVLGKSLT